MMTDDIAATRKQRGEQATAQQRRAADPARSVWVEASAGTGKTKVLSDRVLRLLLNGVPPGRILCLTYTKAAAVEMSSRIAGRLSRWAVAGDDDLHKELSKLLGSLPENHKDYARLEAQARKLFAILLDTPGGMKIQTIHSFCQEVLKRFPLEAKVSPYFEVMDDRTAAEAMDDIKRALLQKIETAPESRAGQALAYLTRNVSEFQFPNIMNSIAAGRNKIVRLFAAYGDAGAVIDELSRRLNVGEKDTAEGLTEAFMAKIDRAETLRLIEAWQHGGVKDKAKAEKLAAVSEAGFPAEMYENYKTAFLTQKGEPYAKAGDRETLKHYAALPESAAAEAERILALEDKLKSVRLLASTRAVLFLAEDLISGYNRFKKVHSKMDYEDLIVLTRALLENRAVADWVLFKLDGGIDHVLIDEAQDTSPDQWAIVKALTADFFAGEGAGEAVRTVFAVGDRKQSIYSFQGADPRGFDEIRKYFAAQSANFDQIHLDVSFRSTAAVLDTVNELFRDGAAAKGVAGEGEDIAHIPFRFGDGGKVELWPLIEPEEGENKDIWLPPVERRGSESTSARLARQIARRIKQSVESRDILVSQNRPVRYKDFMILVQRRNAFVEEMVRECKNAGVNVAGIDKIRLLEQIAIQDLIALGQFLLLPNDDLTLATVLKSPLFGLNDDDLFRLCYGRGTATVWARLGKDEKYAAVYGILQDLLDKADYIRPFELYGYVLSTLGGRKKFVERMGYEVEDGLDEFVNLTLAYEQEHVPTLQGFISRIKQDEIEIKRELEQSDADVVRIMTVHGSKGLQAPIVILPDTVRVVGTKKEGGLLWDDIFYYPLTAGDYEKNCAEIKNREAELALEEYRRLLYVALTRAEDRLCICGYRKKNKASDESWYELCRRCFAGISEKKSDGTLVYEKAQLLTVKENEPPAEKELPRPVFSWISQAAPEEDALSRPYTPSRPDDDEQALASPLGENGNSRYRRGRLIHKLLQFLPDVRSADKRQVVRDFLAKEAYGLTADETERICGEVMSLLENPRFSALFGANSRAEVPIMGVVDGRIVSAQVDRLAVFDDRVLVVDFKTNRPAAEKVAEVPSVYVRQLGAYRKLLAEVYPGRKIETWILWTDTARLMEIA